MNLLPAELTEVYNVHLQKNIVKHIYSKVGKYCTFYIVYWFKMKIFAFTFAHLTDTFIQSNL